MCEKLRFGTGCPTAAQRVGRAAVTGSLCADVLLGSSFPQQPEQLQCESLGQLIFPPPEPDLCLLHRNLQPGHSWGHIWTEPHRSRPCEGTALLKDHCAPGAVPGPSLCLAINHSEPFLESSCPVPWGIDTEIEVLVGSGCGLCRAGLVPSPSQSRTRECEPSSG